MFAQVRQIHSATIQRSFWIAAVCVAVVVACPALAGMIPGESESRCEETEAAQEFINGGQEAAKSVARSQGVSALVPAVRRPIPILSRRPLDGHRLTNGSSAPMRC